MSQHSGIGESSSTSSASISAPGGSSGTRADHSGTNDSLNTNNSNSNSNSNSHSFNNSNTSMNASDVLSSNRSRSLSSDTASSQGSGSDVVNPRPASTSITSITSVTSVTSSDGASDENNSKLKVSTLSAPRTPGPTEYNSSGYREEDEKTSKMEIVRQIFQVNANEDVGELLKDFSCAFVDNVMLHGRMYITSKFICFYSNVFGSEKKIRIPFTIITKISRENTLSVIPNAISVSTLNVNSVSKHYLWRSFWDREECFNLINEQIKKAAIRKANRRMSREPGSLNATAAAVGGSTPNVESVIKVSNPVATHHRAHPSSLTNAVSDHHQLNNNEEGQGDENNVETESGGERKDIEPGDGSSVKSVNDLKKEFQEHVKRSKLSNLMVSDTIMCSVKEFVSLFISDDAVHPYHLFHESQGDWDLVMSKWERSTGIIGQQRELKFVKPIPQIRSKTRGLKAQSFSYYGDSVGFVVCGSTTLEDVTAADAFTVEDSIIVTSSGDNTVLVEIYLEVKFIKSTWFKSLIESNTISETKGFMEKYVQFLKKCTSNKAESASITGIATDNGGDNPNPNSNTSASSTAKARTDKSTAATATSSSSISTTALSSATSPSSSTLPSWAIYLASAIKNLLLSIDQFSINCGFGGGRVFWIAWLLLILVFRSMVNSYRGSALAAAEVEKRLRALEESNEMLRESVTTLIKTLEQTRGIFDKI